MSGRDSESTFKTSKQMTRYHITPDGFGGIEWNEDEHGAWVKYDDSLAAQSATEPAPPSGFTSWHDAAEHERKLRLAHETLAPHKGRAACDCKRDGMGMMRPCPDKPDDRYCRLAHQRCEHCPEETLVEHMQRQDREESALKSGEKP